LSYAAAASYGHRDTRGWRYADSYMPALLRALIRLLLLRHIADIHITHIMLAMLSVERYVSDVEDAAGHYT